MKLVQDFVTHQKSTSSIDTSQNNLFGVEKQTRMRNHIEDYIDRSPSWKKFEKHRQPWMTDVFVKTRKPWDALTTT